MNSSLVLRTLGVLATAAALAASGTDAAKAPPAAASALRPDQQLWVSSYEAEQQGQYDRALKVMETVRSAQGDYYLANLRSGWLHYLKKEYDKAMPFYRKAAQLAPGALSPLVGQMNCQEALGATEDALKTGTSLLVLDPMNTSVNRRIADLHYVRKDYARAISYYLKLCTLYPEDLDCANALAWSYLNLGQVADAQAVFANILVVAPAHASALQGQALCAPAPAKPTAKP